MLGHYAIRSSIVGLVAAVSFACLPASGIAGNKHERKVTFGFNVNTLFASGKVKSESKRCRRGVLIVMHERGEKDPFARTYTNKKGHWSMFVGVLPGVAYAEAPVVKESSLPSSFRGCKRAKSKQITITQVPNPNV